MTGTPHIVRHVMVRGQVQGVGFRYWTEKTARALGIEGWVRNRRDGAVEAAFAGAPERVSAMVEACRRGPPGARVDRLEVREASTDLLGDSGGFSTRPTA